jgi:transcriptional regulator with XRE-family HTH domain
MNIKVKRKNRGTSLEELLEEDGILEEATNAAIKSVLAWQFSQAMKKRKITKQEMALKMKTSRAQLDRLLDPASGNVTLNTLHRAARAVGKSLRFELV